jgi:hypothetical protein
VAAARVSAHVQAPAAAARWLLGIIASSISRPGLGDWRRCAAEIVPRAGRLSIEPKHHHLMAGIDYTSAAIARRDMGRASRTLRAIDRSSTLP